MRPSTWVKINPAGLVPYGEPLLKNYLLGVVKRSGLANPYTNSLIHRDLVGPRTQEPFKPRVSITEHRNVQVNSGVRLHTLLRNLKLPCVIPNLKFPALLLFICFNTNNGIFEMLWYVWYFSFRHIFYTHYKSFAIH